MQQMYPEEGGYSGYRAFEPAFSAPSSASESAF